jgi:DNA-binding MarR family transcriptional regulator
MNDSSTRGSSALAFLLIGTVHEMEARFESTLGQVGLSLAKLNVLSRLAEAGEPVPLGTLAERCSCVRSNITQLVDRLEADRLVERVSDPNDRRSVRAALTAEGTARHGEGARLLEEAGDAFLGQLGEVERIALASLLERLGRS